MAGFLKTARVAAAVELQELRTKKINNDSEQKELKCIVEFVFLI